MTQVVHAVLMNLNDTRYESATFILPSALPEDRPASYRVVFDTSDEIYRVSKAPRLITTKPMAPIVLSFDNPISRTLLTIPTSKTSPSVSAPAGSINDEHSLNTKPANTLPLTTKPRQVEVTLVDPASVTAITSSAHTIPEGKDAAVNTQTAQSSVSRGSRSNSLYHSATGEDWSLMDEEERKKENSKTRTQCTELLIVFNQVVGQEYMESSGKARTSSNTPLSAPSLSNIKHGEPSDVGRLASTTGIAGSRNVDNEFPLPQLRRYILPQAKAEIEEEFENILPHTRTIDRARYARGIVEWRYMCEASKQLLACGDSKRRPQLKEADRSVAWFWNVDSKGNTIGAPVPHQANTGGRQPTNPYRGAPAASLVAKQALAKRPIHHLSFARRPVAYRSTTPPAVSLWAAFSSDAADRCVEAGFPLRTHILASQAGQYLDPFTVSSDLEAFPELHGTKLQEAVTGYVEKAYDSDGTWQFEELEPDEDRPRNQLDAGYFWHGDMEDCNYPVEPYRIQSPDGSMRDVDLSVNDDGRVHQPSPPKYKFMKIPSKLRYVKVCEYSQDKPMALLSSKEPEPVGDPSVEDNIEEQGDISPHDHSLSSDGATAVEDGVEDGLIVVDIPTAMDEVDKRSAQEQVLITQTPRLESPSSYCSMSSSDEDESSEYTNRTSSRSLGAVDESCSPSSAEDNGPYTDLCMMIKDIDEIVEVVESRYDELSNCDSRDYGSDIENSKTPYEGSLTLANDLDNPVSRSVGKEAIPELVEELAKCKLADTPENIAAEEKQITEDAQKGLDGLSNCSSWDHGSDNVEPEAFVEDSLAGVDDLPTTTTQAVEEDPASELVKVLVEFGITDAPAEEVMQENNPGLVGVSEELIRQDTPGETSAPDVAKETSATDDSQDQYQKHEAEPELVEESAEGEITDASGNEVVEERDNGVANASEEPDREDAFKEAPTAPELIEEAAEGEIADPLGDEVVEKGDSGAKEAFEDVVQEPVPEEIGITVHAFEETPGENCARCKEDEKQADLETSEPDEAGLSGKFSGTFSLPRLSGCLLYGSIVAYVGFRVYRALRR